MSKASRARKKLKRDAVKSARRSKNYARRGPKEDYMGRRQRKRAARHHFKPGPAKGGQSVQSPKGRNKLKRRMRHPLPSTLGTPKRPLKSLRKRLTPEQMEKRLKKIGKRKANRLDSNGASD